MIYRRRNTYNCLNRAPSRRFRILCWRAVRDSEGAFGLWDGESWAASVVERFGLAFPSTLGGEVVSCLGRSMFFLYEFFPIFCFFFVEDLLISWTHWSSNVSMGLRFLETQHRLSRLIGTGIGQPETWNNAIRVERKKKGWAIRSGVGLVTVCPFDTVPSSERHYHCHYPQHSFILKLT